jgi:hypothetical protein
MPGSKSDFLENKVLDHLYGNTPYTPPANYHLALFIVAPTDAGGGTECSAGNYARKQIANNTTNFPNAVGGSKSIATQQDFITANADWAPLATPAVAFGYFDQAAPGGNLHHWGWLGSDPGRIFTAETTGETLSVPGHSLIVNDVVRVIAVPGSTLPGGLAAGTTYFVKTVSGDLITLSATLGGATIDITASGSGSIAKIAAKPILNGDTAQFPPGSLIITEE